MSRKLIVFLLSLFHPQEPPLANLQHAGVWECPIALDDLPVEFDSLLVNQRTRFALALG
jgi:hypothetical protein